jgi:hypothetical protein
MQGFGRAAAGALVALTLVAGSGAAAIAAPASTPTAVQLASLPKIPSQGNPYLAWNRAGIGDNIMVYPYVFVPPGGVTYTYQWYRDGKPIAGDTSSKHKLVAADKGRTLHTVVTAHKAGYADTALKSGTTVQNFEYKLMGKPSIWATDPIVGTPYTAETGEDAVPVWASRPDKLTYQWNLDGKPVTGATKPTYKVAAADYGKKLSVTVTAHAHGYTPATNTSAQTNTIKKGYATYKKPLFVTGKAKAGSTLGVTDGQWLAGAKLSYQWYYLVDNKVGWKPISGATKSMFKIDSEYAGKRIYAQVTGSKAGYISSSAWSSWSGVIAR